MDMYHLHDEAAPTDMSALDSVVDYIRDELKKLEEMEEKIMTEFGPEDERLQAIYERFEELDPTTFEVWLSSCLSCSRYPDLLPLECPIPLGARGKLSSCIQDPPALDAVILLPCGVSASCGFSEGGGEGYWPCSSL